MSAESDRDAALELQSAIKAVNDRIDHAREIGLRVDLTIEMVKAPGLPASNPHIYARVLKPIDPGEKT